MDRSVLRLTFPPRYTNSFVWLYTWPAASTLNVAVDVIKTGREGIEATLRRRRILFAGFVTRMEDTRLTKCVMFGELVGRGLCGGPGKVMDGMFPG